VELNIKGNQLHNLEVVYKKIDELIPYINNTRTHSNEQVAQIASSIKEFGFTNSILLDEKDGVIAGHGRIMAAKLLKMDEVPTITLSGLTEAQIKAYIIADNKLALNAGWDEEMLKLEIEALYEMDYNIDLLGFSMEELEDLDINFGEPDMPLDESKADDVPELVENPVIKLGDLIELGHNYQHRLLCGDSTSEDDVKRLMDGKKADMVLTDPPYQGKMGSGGFKNDKKLQKSKDALVDSIRHLYDFNPTDTFPIIEKFKKDKISTFLFCNKNLVPTYLNWGVDNDRLFDVLTWHKVSTIPANNNTYYPDTEYLIKLKDKGAVFNTGLGKETVNYGKYWVLNSPVQDQKTEHPTVKPQQILNDCILICSNRRDLVLDLFLGSGSTMIACENADRLCYGMELDEKYAQVIIQRYVDYTSNPMIKINGQEVDWHEYKEKNSLA
jgi:DNA modification methylase